MWVTSKLGETCKMYQPKTITKKEMVTDGKYDVYGANGIIGKHNKYNHEEPQLLIGCRGTCGSVNVSTPFSWINGNSMVIQPDTSKLSLNFMKYIFQGGIDLSRAISGTAQPQITAKSLNGITFFYPPLEEQERIVAKLDAAFAEIDEAIEAANKNIKSIRNLFDTELMAQFKNLKSSSKIISIADACEDIFAGGDAPKVAFSKFKTEEYNIPIFANAAKQKGLYGFTDIPRVNVPAVTIAGRGSGTGYTEIRMEPFLPIVRLIVLLPKPEIVSIEFLKKAILSLDVLSSGSAIPQLTVPMIKTYKIPVPTLNEQKNLIKKLDEIEVNVSMLAHNYVEKISNYNALKSAILAQELQSSEAA